MFKCLNLSNCLSYEQFLLASFPMVDIMREKAVSRRLPKLSLLKIKMKEPLSVRSFVVSLSERK